MDRGLEVNELLETSAPGIFAAGDIARWPDPHTGERIRVEHWVVAQRQGQAAARNMLGDGERIRRGAVLLEPALRRADQLRRARGAWDRIEVEGNIAERDCAVRYVRGGRTLALATIYRDKESLEFEASLEGAQPQPEIAL